MAIKFRFRRYRRVYQGVGGVTDFNEKVLRLEIAMEDVVAVADGYSTDQLVEERLQPETGG